MKLAVSIEGENVGLVLCSVFDGESMHCLESGSGVISGA